MERHTVQSRNFRHWKRTGFILAIGAVCLLGVGLMTARADKAADQKQLIERGKFIVTVGGCNDCHTPWIMTAGGPRSDSTRFLSGHPAGMLAPAPKLDMPWMAACNATFTAWSGPWGISYTANLTPDSSGMGVWTEDMFIQAMRTGKHWGVSRPIMPPMPFETLGKLPDSDLKAIFVYLRTIPPVHNIVPDYEPPAEAPGGQH